MECLEHMEDYSPDRLFFSAAIVIIIDHMKLLCMTNF